MQTTRKVSAAEIIATVIGWDWDDVKANIYQPTRYSSPSVYVYGSAFLCCPGKGRQPPKSNFDKWTLLGEAFGRPVYISGTP